MRTLMSCAVAMLAASVSSAEQTVQQRRPAAPDAVVQIQLSSGSLKVIGWDRPEVSASGTIDDDAQGLVLTGRPQRIQVEVDGDHPGMLSRLEVHVPAGSRVEIESQSAAIMVTGISGAVRAESVEGSISIQGTMKEVDAQTVNDGISVTCHCTRTRAEAVNGPVSVRGASGQIDASTVNGTLRVEGGSFERAALETVNGDIDFVGTLDARGTLEIETVAGSVGLTLPARIAAEFTIATFSGRISNDLTADAAERGSRHTTRRNLEFTSGGGGATVDVQTLSGSVHLRQKP